MLFKAADVSATTEKLTQRKDHSGDLPFWSSAALKIFLVQPPSAAVKRVFPLLKHQFTEQQQNSLYDYVEAS